MEYNRLNESQSEVELDGIPKSPIVLQPSSGFGRFPRDMKNNRIYYPKPTNRNVSARPICIILVMIPLLLVCAVRLFFIGKPLAGVVILCSIFLAIIFLLWYVTCNLNGRQMFMRWLNNMYVNCCCRIDFTSKLSLADAIGRYEEQPVLTSKEITEVVINHPFLVAIMETLCNKMPNFFFSYLMSGSLREGFGKILPSTSILASDYDIMLIPDGVSVAVNFGLNGCKGGQDTSPVFTAVETENSKGHVWLKLEDKYLEQWEKFCLRRHAENEGCSFLSSKLFISHLKDIITESTDILHFVSKQFNSKLDNVCITGVPKGPALNIEVKVVKQGVVCSGDKWQKLFDADFTLALHCRFWPEAAKGFFEVERRKNWPDIEVVNTIRKLGCHVTPKASTTALFKLLTEQPEYTTYGQSTSLEWRYSFSQAEIILSDNIPSSARSAFLALKAVNKRHFHRKGKEIPSYALKCILLTLVEKKPESFWECSNSNKVVEEFFSEMLQELQQRLRERNCPNYWIPQINLFQDFTDPDYYLKEMIVDVVRRKPVSFVADGYLEYVRYSTLSCCYCGEKGYIEDTDTHHILNNVDLREPCFITQVYTCSNTNSSGLFGPCSYDRVSLDVY